MKNFFPSLKKYLVACMAMVFCIETPAQVCQNTVDTVYGLTSIGEIYPINVNNATVGSLIGATSDGLSANGMGYSNLNGRFYFFNRCNTGVAGDTIQFVSFNPANSVKQVLADPPSTFTTAHKNRSGTVTRNGTGYYAIHPGATGGPAFYYYSLGSNSWTTVTQTFKDVSGNVVAPITSLNSGDMAFDGNDNLWIVSANSIEYALYRINAPVPTTVVTHVTVDTIIPVTANPISGASFTGIAFNSAGDLFLSTGAGVSPANNKLYKLPSAGTSVSLIGSLPNGYGDDLTSCTYPQAVLSVQWVSFSASLRHSLISLTWQINEKETTTGYDVQYSANGQDWQSVKYLNKDSSTGAYSLKTYTYSHANYLAGVNYYRIIEIATGGKKSISPIRIVNTNDLQNISIGPNPAKDILYLYRKYSPTSYLARIYDKTGRLVHSSTVTPSQQSLNIDHLSKGMYILTLSPSSGKEIPRSYRFIK